MPTDEALREKIRAIADDVHEIRRLLDGAGDPSKGIVVRLDRLEQDAQGHKWLFKTAIGAIVAVVIRFGWELIRH